MLTRGEVQIVQHDIGAVRLTHARDAQHRRVLDERHMIAPTLIQPCRRAYQSVNRVSGIVRARKIKPAITTCTNLKSCDWKFSAVRTTSITPRMDAREVS